MLWRYRTQEGCYIAIIRHSRSLLGQGMRFPITTCGLKRRKPWILMIGLSRRTLAIKAERALLDIQGLRKELKGTIQNRDTSTGIEGTAGEAACRGRPKFLCKCPERRISLSILQAPQGSPALTICKAQRTRSHQIKS